MTIPLYINADNLIRLDNTRLASDSSYVTTGTGTWTLRNSVLTMLAQGSMSYVTGSQGRWQGTIDKVYTADLTEGVIYYLDVELGDGLGADGFWRSEMLAQYHQAGD